MLQYLWLETKKPPENQKTFSIILANLLVFRFMMGQQGFNVEARTALNFQINFADVLPDEADRQQLDAAEEPEGQHDGGPSGHRHADAKRYDGVNTGADGA